MLLCNPKGKPLGEQRYDKICLKRNESLVLCARCMFVQFSKDVLDELTILKLGNTSVNSALGIEEKNKNSSIYSSISFRQLAPS